jgi:glycosyltransferase involved in cell wall biosynthesis
MSASLLQNSIIFGEETLKELEAKTGSVPRSQHNPVINVTNTKGIFESDKKPQVVNMNIFQNSQVVSSERWWKPSANGKKRIMLCGTYPIAASNGYSKVVYYICKYLGTFDDIELTVYGFQNFVMTSGSNIRNDIPPSVKIHDAYATENPKRNGFGELEISSYLKANPQDVIIIFNDAVVTSALTQNILKDCGSERHNFRLVSYMDQVYPYQKKDYINLLNNCFDAVIAFTPYWEGIARKLGIKESMPMYSFPHGFDEKLYFPIPMKLCRMYFNFDPDAFMVLNLNRNQPRKRWDVTMIAWAEFVERHYQANVKNKKGDFKTNKHTRRPIKLVVGTQMDGYWDLMDVLENEIKFRDVPFEYAKSTIQRVNMPQQLSDRDINILYNSCDVGLNSADGEGYGLCGFESAALGKAQVSANIGGMKEFLNPQNSILIDPVMSLYLDNKSKGIPGKTELTNPHEYAEAFWRYFSNPELVEKHGRRGRENILTHYRWETLVTYFYKTIIPKL